MYFFCIKLFRESTFMLVMNAHVYIFLAFLGSGSNGVKPLTIVPKQIDLGLECYTYTPTSLSQEVLLGHY